MRAIFFDEDDARAAVARLVHDGFSAELERERLAGEDDDEDHPWAVVSDAPEFVLELLVEERDGWLDTDSAQPTAQPTAQSTAPTAAPTAAPATPLELPTAPRRVKRPDLLGRPADTTPGATEHELGSDA